MAGFSRAKIWGVFAVLFVCGALVGIGIANWGRVAQSKRMAAPVVQERVATDEHPDAILTPCQSIEKVLLERVQNQNGNCDWVHDDMEIYKKLVTYGCDENREKYKQELSNKIAILEVACPDYNGNVSNDSRACEQIEQSLINKYGLNYNDSGMSKDERIDRAKAYALMAERGCPENVQMNTDLARKELEIARGISDEQFDEDETIEVVETYKRLKMQQDAQEVFNKVKKMTNPAIDFIIQVEKIINE